VPEQPVFPTAHEFKAQFPNVDPGHEAAVLPDYPETAEETGARTARTIALLCERYEGNIVLASHGAAIWGLARGLVADASVHPALCCLIRIVGHDNTWTVEADGTDVSHLSVTDAGPLRLH